MPLPAPSMPSTWGTCLTTDAELFKGDCVALHESASDADSKTAWEVRAKIAEVSTLYATYAHDPKTSSDAPRAILQDSDLLKISIEDPDRDKRSPILVQSAVTNGVTISNSGDGTGTDTSALTAIQDFLAADSKVPIVGSDNKTEVVVKTGMVLDAADAIRANSGNETLNFSGNSAATDPMDVTGNIRFFGCTVANNTKTCGVDGDDKGIDDTELQDVSGSIEVDEDASSGENSDANVAPWLAVNASVPANKDILIYAIYYETSSKESLIGGESYYHCTTTGHKPVDRGGTTGWKCDDPDSTTDGDVSERDAATNVVYTKDEMDDNDALLVQATSDGDLQKRSVHLNLKETKRFSGVYQGCVRLTDANGDGRDPDSKNRSGQLDQIDITSWGRQVASGTAVGKDCAGAAVLAVDQGPVLIEYRDSDGKKQTLRIEVDNVAPTVNVASPVHGSSSDDQSPDFAGTLEDSGSGLADNSFRLVVDNKVDNKGGVDGKNDDYVLNELVDELNVTDNTDTSNNVGPTTGSITHIGEYTGYDTNKSSGPSQFGIVMKASDLYDLNDDSCDNRDKCHILAEAYDDGATRGTFDDDLRLDLQDGDGDVDTQDKEFQIDFQAFVMDMAGNIGFSDADLSNPRYINDLGQKMVSKRKPGNVLGYYSGHIITLDEKDPDLIETRSATGYYGLNADDKAIPDRYGIMVEFDGAISEPSVSTNSFSVMLDDGTAARVVDFSVEKNFVFLKLASELKSDATPMIDIAQNQKIEDLAGNETFGREQDAFEAQDGISPKLTVTLNGGSGTGTGDEGPSKLTKDQITINVSSDEALQGAPRISVVCSTLAWNESTDADVEEAVEGSANVVGYDIDDFIDNRSGAFSSNQPGETPITTKPDLTNKNKAGAAGETYQYTCGYDANTDKFDDEFQIGTPASGLARPGDNWDYTWKDPGGNYGTDPTAFKDGTLTVVAYARDRSRYDHGGVSNVQNWGSTSAEFTLDTELASPLDGSGEVQPKDGGTSKEARPFVMIRFGEDTSVTLDSVELNDVEIATDFTEPEVNQFVYWPPTLMKGDHEVEVEATDAAGNERAFEFSFKVEERGDFLLNLLAGWNAISVPADPIDTAIGAVFTDPAIESVIGWDTQGWRMAVRRDGVWESNQQYGTLNEIRSKYGYWVKSNNFVQQPIALTANDRGVGGPRQPKSIDIVAGKWNFVGVIDQDGDQTEGESGNSLKDSGGFPINAGEYLGADYVRAYTWNATFNRFDVLRKDNDVTIGAGIWVYTDKGIAP